jgi:oxalate decarboxylase
MHWHNAAEWAYILDGHCQVTVVDPEGETEVANYGPGDLWYFPKGHSHAIQTLGSEPCHAILAFDDGLYGEHGTFGLSDWISRLDGGMAAQVAGVSKDVVAQMPPGEVYIMQGAVIARDGPQARVAKPLNRKRTHRFALTAQPPLFNSAAGTIRIASAREFPVSSTITGMQTRLKPGGYHEPHWHPHANEWLYLAKGKARLTLFALDKRLASAELAAGDCAYIPRGCGHSEQNVGSEECEIIGVLDSGKFQEAALSDWMSKAPRHLLANNLGLSETVFAGGHKGKLMLTI